MAYEPRPGDGALFLNDRRTTEKHPNAKGYVIAHRDIKAGEKLDLAAWTKEGAKGKFQSLKMSDSREQQGQGGGGQSQGSDNNWSGGGPDLSDDIPFMPER